MPIVATYPRLGEAADALARDRGSRFLAGGTLVMREVNEGARDLTTIVRTTDAEFRQIQGRGDRVTIGAGVTMRQVLANRELDFLHPAARLIGGPAIRNMATVGGNLYAPPPYGDLAAALLAMDASVALVGSGGVQEVPLEEFLRARERDPRRLIGSVTLARPQRAGAFRFLKVSRVKPKGVAILSIAAHLPEGGRGLSQVRIAYSGMAPTAIRVPAVERALEGSPLGEASIDAAVRVALEGASPRTDALASDWYRREVAPVHLRRLLTAARNGP